MGLHSVYSCSSGFLGYVYKFEVTLFFFLNYSVNDDTFISVFDDLINATLIVGLCHITK